MQFTPSGVSAMIEGLLTELEVAVQLVGKDTNADSKVIAAITQGMEDAKVALAALSQSDSSSAAQPLVARIITDVEAVDQAVASIPGLPMQVTLALQVVGMLLPVIAGVVQVVWPPVASPTPAPEPAPAAA